MGGQGVFWKQLQQELLDGSCDIAVHSMKDLPTTPYSPLLTIAAIPPLKPREDVVLFKSTSEYSNLDNLPEGAIIGTSSLRRICTLGIKYPHLKIENIRGNLNTRLRKLEEGTYDAIVLAKAGVQRLNWEDKIGQTLSKNEFEYAPAQGSLAVECLLDDKETLKILSFIEWQFARRIIEAERMYLKTLEGGCTLPISVNSQIFTCNKDEKVEITEFEGIDTSSWALRINGRVFDRNNPSDYLEDSVEGDLDNWIEIGQELASKLRDKGATKFIQKEI